MAIFFLFKLTIPKNEDDVPEDVQQWAAEVEQLYNSNGEKGKGARVSLNGAEGCTAYIYNMDASRMSREELGSGFTELPIIELTLVDLPEVSYDKLRFIAIDSIYSPPGNLE